MGIFFWVNWLRKISKAKAYAVVYGADLDHTVDQLAQDTIEGRFKPAPSPPKASSWDEWEARGVI